MQKTHSLLLIICRACLHNRAYQHLQKSAASCIHQHSQKQAHKGITHNLWQNGKQNKSQSCQQMCQNHRCPITNPVHKPNGHQINDQLQTEIKSNQQGNLLQGNLISPLKSQKQQRHKIIYNRLHHIPHETGLQSSVIILFHQFSSSTKIVGFSHL